VHVLLDAAVQTRAGGVSGETKGAAVAACARPAAALILRWCRCLPRAAATSGPAIISWRHAAANLSSSAANRNGWLCLPLLLLLLVLVLVLARVAAGGAEAGRSSGGGAGSGASSGGLRGWQRLRLPLAGAGAGEGEEAERAERAEDSSVDVVALPPPEAASCGVREWCAWYGGRLIR
jgi:hypothetical protein